jgi:mono/diheme cytochrome c family protein
MHAFYALQGLGALDAETVQTALASSNRGLRRAALLTAPADETLAEALVKNDTITAADPRELAEIFVALARVAPSGRIGKALHATLVAEKDLILSDMTLNSAWQAAARRHAAGVLASSESVSTPPAAPVNLLKDPGFDGASLGDWSLRSYKVEGSGTPEMSISPAGRNGGTALKITSTSPADVGAGLEIAVAPNTRYRFGGWIRTENFQNTGGKGAMFNQHGGPASRALAGTKDWEEFNVEFDSGNDSKVLLHCLFGGYGTGTGTAYFDDLYLQPLGAGGIESLLASVAKYHAESKNPAVPAKEMVRKNLPVPAVHERGAAVYARTCIACHGPDGKGVPGAFPPLDGADWAVGDPSIPVRILLAGLQGPIEVSGQKFNNIMPPHTDLKDAEIADVLTYVRQSWSNDATPVSEDFVKQTRAKFAGRGTPWTAAELK